MVFSVRRTRSTSTSPVTIWQKTSSWSPGGDAAERLGWAGNGFQFAQSTTAALATAMIRRLCGSAPSAATVDMVRMTVSRAGLFTNFVEK